MLRTLLLWITVGCTAPAWAAAADQPFEAYARFVRGIYTQWYVPGADDFATQSQALVGPLQQLCAADATTEPEVSSEVLAISLDIRRRTRAQPFFGDFRVRPACPRRGRHLTIAP